MSVINKMLRDLDHRQPPKASASTNAAKQGLREGTVSVAPRGPLGHGARTTRSNRWYWMGLIGLVLVGAAWFWQAGYLESFIAEVAVAPKPAPPIPVQTQPQSVALPTPAPAETASPPDSPLVQAPAAVAVEPVSVPAPRGSTATMVLRMDPSLSLRRILETELAPVSAKPKPMAAEKPSPEKPGSDKDKPDAKTTALAVQTPVPAATPMPPADVAQTAQRQQQAAKEAIAQAQSLWNVGSHDAAIELMQDVVASAERALATSATPANTQLLSQMVRELTRLQLLESRPSGVLDLLTRLEPVLGNQPDLWAVRANAAQRLGRHQDSVHAYMTALQSRPNEQRWLLGAAVSLAALGQTASAADMAGKARAVGVVSKDVLAYLRQMGVPVKD